ncbi:MAG: hypothetical protein ACTSRK_00155 [Promethearchaeota archaeon]
MAGKINPFVLTVKIIRILGQVLVGLIAISFVLVTITSLTSSNDIIQSFDEDKITESIDPNFFMIEDDYLNIYFEFPVENDGKFDMSEFSLFFKIIVNSDNDSFEILNHYTQPETIMKGDYEIIDYQANYGDYNSTELERLLNIAPSWNSVDTLEDFYGLEYEFYLGFETEYSWGLYSFEVEVDIREIIGW